MGFDCLKAAVSTVKQQVRVHGQATSPCPRPRNKSESRRVHGQQQVRVHGQATSPKAAVSTVKQQVCVHGQATSPCPRSSNKSESRRVHGQATSKSVLHWG